MTRSCDIGGVWNQFDENACDSLSGQLNILIDLFSNVREIMVIICYVNTLQIIIIQLTTDTYETAVSRLSQAIELSETNTIEQNSEVLNSVANYSAELATFVEDTNVILNDTVRYRLTH